MVTRQDCYTVLEVVNLCHSENHGMYTLLLLMCWWFVEHTASHADSLNVSWINVSFLVESVWYDACVSSASFYSTLLMHTALLFPLGKKKCHLASPQRLGEEKEARHKHSSFLQITGATCFSPNTLSHQCTFSHQVSNENRQFLRKCK